MKFEAFTLQAVSDSSRSMDPTTWKLEGLVAGTQTWKILRDQKTFTFSKARESRTFNVRPTKGIEYLMRPFFYSMIQYFLSNMNPGLQKN